jgi:hypothetical protein
VNQYLYIESLKVIAVLFSTRETPEKSHVFFRSIGVPKSRLPSINLEKEAYKLFHYDKYLTIDCGEIFELYDLTTHKMVLGSTVHESPIHYVQLYKKDAESSTLIVSATKDGVVRVYDMDKKVLKSIMIC